MWVHARRKAGELTRALKVNVGDTYIIDYVNNLQGSKFQGMACVVKMLKPKVAVVELPNKRMKRIPLDALDPVPTKYPTRDELEKTADGKEVN